MPITHEQKAAIGTWYLAEIDRRIELRTAAKAKCAKAPTLNAADAVAALAEAGIVIPWAKPYEVEHHTYRGGYFEFRFPGDLTINYVPERRCPTYLEPIRAVESESKRKAALCNELEFLHKLKGGAKVGEFQAHVSRLWAPKTKTETLSRTALLGHFDAYCDSKRGFSCPL